MKNISLEESLKQGYVTDLIDNCHLEDGEPIFSARFNTCFADSSLLCIDFKPFHEFTISPAFKKIEMYPDDFFFTVNEATNLAINIAHCVLSRTSNFDGYIYKTQTSNDNNNLNRLKELQDLFLKWDPKNYVPVHGNPYINVSNKKEV